MALETMDLHEVRSAMEGILFAAGEPVTAQRLCLGLETDRATLDRAAQAIPVVITQGMDRAMNRFN